MEMKTGYRITKCKGKTQKTELMIKEMKIMMNIIENINELINVTGGSGSAAEPPKYTSPEAEAMARRMKEELERLKRNGRYVPIESDSDLLVFVDRSIADKHPGSGFPG